MPYLVISLIISLKNHESPCNLVFFWASTKSHTQKRQAKRNCGCHVLAAEKPQSRCGFGWSGGWFPWEIVVTWLRNVQIAKWRGRNPGAASSSICRIGSLLNLPAHAWEKHVLSLGAAWRSQAAMIVVFTIVIMHCNTIWCVSKWLDTHEIVTYCLWENDG